MEKLVQKLTSRKFWFAVAAFLASFGAGIAGLKAGNEIIAAVGTVCAVLSASIYAAAEAYVDAARLEASMGELEADESDEE